MKTAKTKNSSLSSNRYIKDLVQNKDVYILFIPVLAYFIIFKYLPMYGAMIAFKGYVPAKGILGSDWVGMANLFFTSSKRRSTSPRLVEVSLTGLRPNSASPQP